MGKEKPKRHDPINNAIEILENSANKIMKENNLEIKLIPISSIFELKLKNDTLMHNRISYSKSKLLELANNIQQLATANTGILGTGLLNPVMLRNNNGKLERIHGDNRIKALKLNNALDVPAIILDNVSDELARFMRSSENLKREDLNAYDETLSILEHIQLACNFDNIDLVKSFINKVKNFQQGKSTLSDDEKELYKNVTKVFNKIGRFDIITFVDRLSVLKLNPLIKQALVDEKINYSQAKFINSKLKKDEEIIKIINLLVVKNLSIKELKLFIFNMLNEGSSNIKSIIEENKLITIKQINQQINKYKYNDVDEIDKIFIDTKLDEIISLYKVIENKLKK